MREFLKSRRRKLGVVSLVLTCVFLAGWLRSFTMTDRVILPTGVISQYRLYSMNQELIWESITSRWARERISPSAEWKSFEARRFYDDLDICFRMDVLLEGSLGLRMGTMSWGKDFTDSRSVKRT